MKEKKPFLPCLLERLLDDEPKRVDEPWDKFHFDQRMMKTLILQNISEILNNANIEPQLEPAKHSEVARSVINYGVSPQVGSYTNTHNWTRLEYLIRDALIRFEPRLIPESIIVSLNGERRSPIKQGIISFNIHALVAWSPHPFDLSLGARYEVETESINLQLV
ncbi:type VI secretion system baseplate subunit TssE [Pantoea sp. NPDC088449]|jgi:type VI secretion system protein ImpF|uniref:Type VI secretion system protein ImpF n=1 Tax=Candidatus Pantoea floridensis TaxID=1938870 RepID=A0A286BQ84_9GAMM|nr:GPW/gp25 family protein [Pantoea floridensis]PIF22963.1 type VI secretion system protein ImpF [Enterobacteriaceae bacterium JKS000233]SOD36300.1 type VI secretion system protein ImpF [Pantoea floridensis]HBZ17294.1 type VI secretion system baseplate subunit TssE [Pantoea sp.]